MLSKIEIVFLLEDDPNSGYTATALGQSIFTQADDIETLQFMIPDTVQCHFTDKEKRPKIIHLQNIL
ncbi:2-oxoisovalerate dehydrogenase E1 subunit beta [Aphanizomenon flos-aquae]|uniref:2-oxoisovalerate dehydrogenase E1 subunit beta n=1 Tax=Aphanizomenon sp. FACHB-1399 TaxID=2692773 RepID=UPI0030B80815